MTQFSPVDMVEGRPKSVRRSHAPNLVQIFKGLVTLNPVNPFLFTIRHTTARCLIKPVLEKTWWSPFTGGLLVVQGNCTPNLDQKFAQHLFIPAGPLSFMFLFHYSKFQFAIEPTSNRNNTIFFF